MTLETASGTLVPAAKKVIPMTESGIFSVSPMMVIIQATTYDNDPIHMIHITNVKGNHFLNLSFSQSGIVTRKTRCMGQVKTQVNYIKKTIQNTTL